MSQTCTRMKQLATTKDNRGYLPVSPATVWRWVAAGRFPKPFKLGDGTTVWNMADIEAWQRAKQWESQQGAT